MSLNIDKRISKFIIDAFDMDIQIFYSKALSNLQKSPAGCQVSNWANKNPQKFKNFLRGLSVFIRSVPKNSKFLPEIVFDHLTRLPLEIQRTIEKEGSDVKNLRLGGEMNSSFNNESFTKNYVAALEDLSEDQLRNVASLKKSQLIEWVSTPSRLRPYVLENLISKSKPEILLDKSKDNIASAIKTGKDDFKVGIIHGIKWFWGIIFFLFVLFAFLIKIYG